MHSEQKRYVKSEETLWTGPLAGKKLIERRNDSIASGVRVRQK